MAIIGPRVIRELLSHYDSCSIFVRRGKVSEICFWDCRGVLSPHRGPRASLCPEKPYPAERDAKRCRNGLPSNPPVEPASPQTAFPCGTVALACRIASLPVPPAAPASLRMLFLDGRVASASLQMVFPDGTVALACRIASLPVPPAAPASLRMVSPDGMAAPAFRCEPHPQSACALPAAPHDPATADRLAPCLRSSTPCETAVASPQRFASAVSAPAGLRPPDAPDSSRGDRIETCGPEMPAPETILCRAVPGVCFHVGPAAPGADRKNSSGERSVECRQTASTRGEGARLRVPPRAPRPASSARGVPVPAARAPHAPAIPTALAAVPCEAAAAQPLDHGAARRLAWAPRLAALTASPGAIPPQKAASATRLSSRSVAALPSSHAGLHGCVSVR